MTLKKIPVNELKPGMIFDKSVYIDENNILVPPMVPIKEEDINRLVRWGIEEVETEGELIREGKTAKPKNLKEEIKRLEKEAGIVKPEAGLKSFQNVYDETVELIREIFDSVKNAVSYSQEKIYRTAEKLIEAVESDKNNAIEVAIGEHDQKYLYVLGASVGVLSAVTGISLNFNEERLKSIVIGGWLHDIGMIKVPPYITEKKGKLTPDEYARIKTHPIYGYRIILNDLMLNNEIANVALQHHESYDGTGYPRKLKGNQISIYARIVAICDSYETKTRKRSYRDEMMYYNAMKTIVSASNRRFDPNIVKVFLSNMAIYPVGSVVKLNNGVVARVIKANPNLPLRPIIEVLIDEFGDKLKSGERVIDLQNESSFFIKSPLSKEEVKRLLNE